MIGTCRAIDGHGHQYGWSAPTGRRARLGTIALLVVITGPIASGKSTVARLLAAEFRRAGRCVATVDIDDTVEMIGGFGTITDERFRQVQRVHGKLVASWLCQGIDVIAHGPFYEPREIDALLEALPHGTNPNWLVLDTTYELALDRVQADPNRDLSKDPAILRLAYDRAEALRPGLPPNRWTYDTSEVTGEQIAADVAGSLME
ncbi:AAA family ATPase [Candidatus Neomicrothrix sp.]|uniref:AAA family ATPase n=1 Tax=Candidatus Neomicrothrix subdominans TaxID=2954438 RepID=A0A936NER8_9ACTN|nr:AAA family ATPase [Candidatus Microthrix sp.]MBK9297544.1 AAA family ATPase [Candidatus Microthrix subdominans]MBK6309528.1 AAA family ATPase [Candidatus Microthrix sp.]MBK6437612.1 AAA family ATPase [Candidatus Microthrix sp.]MBK7166074.1 AAA family ATPase [Candidatus Microthrix sp.]MBP7594802.1 AAA family ATPase [Candidatus Microthrix sp.]